jgi:hypothetical protein
MYPEETKELSHSPRKALIYFQTMDVGTKRHPRWSCFSALTVSVIAILKPIKRFGLQPNGSDWMDCCDLWSSPVLFLF